MILGLRIGGVQANRGRIQDLCGSQADGALDALSHHQAEPLSSEALHLDHLDGHLKEKRGFSDGKSG